MACCLFPSLSSSSSSSRSSSKAINNVRVVALNGYVEEFDYPVSVSEVTGQPPKHFVFTSDQLLSSAIKPLKLETLLQPGHIYFMLPCTAFQTDVSPLGLASIVKKLTEKAKSNGSSPARSPLPTANDVERMNGNGKRSIVDKLMERAKSTNSFPARSPLGTANEVEKVNENGKRSWKPILDTIREMSFKRSESDLKEIIQNRDYERPQYLR